MMKVNDETMKNLSRKISLLRGLSMSVMTLCFFSLPKTPWGSVVDKSETEKIHPERIMTAVRVNSNRPQIDGILDDEVWRDTPIATGFVQKDPNHGEPATEKTTVQVVYDNEALYIGVVCYDEPDKIVSRLGRRDQELETDRVILSLDPRHDHQTGWTFSVAPSGWITDSILYDDDQKDTTWDGIWKAAAKIHAQGWSVEYKIPYHVLRFSEEAEYTWGINVERHIVRKEERDQWILEPRGESGWVSRFGHLKGIKGIKPPKHIEVFPFAVGRSTLKSKHESDVLNWFTSTGLDLRYGLTSNLSLNATFNPDFGQVEADPAVLNLSVFETFFEERRPFFIEGDTIFRAPRPNIVRISGPSQLFYSRRIGKQPKQFEIPDNSTEVHRPDATTIVGAVKLSGKTKRRTAFGIVEAVTANEYATVKQTTIDPITGQARTKQWKHRVEPLTNFFVGRIQQDIKTNSSVGTTLTAVNRQDMTSAYVASIDSTLKWKENAYRIFTRLTGTQTGTVNNRKDGYEVVGYFSKFSGWFGGQAYFDVSSPEFEINDLGFMDRANRIQLGGHIFAQIQNPWALARQSAFNVNVWSRWSYNGLCLKKGLNFNTWHELKNYWWYVIGISREFKAFDDLETRGGPVMVRPAQLWYLGGIGTDRRKLISFSFDTFGNRDDEGSSWRQDFSIRVRISPISNIEFEIGPSYKIENDFAQWIENLDDDKDGEIDHYIFGELQSRVVDFTTRVTAAFTPTLTLQLYLQPFVAVGDYSNFKELAHAESYDFTLFPEPDKNPDFSHRSLRSNLVLRWEYQLGSTLFLVWSQSRSESFDINNPEFEPFGDLGDSFTATGENIFLGKLNYWLGL